jgi:hypothetical protein
MKQSLYHRWMVQLQMFLAAREARPGPGGNRPRGY